MTNPSNSTPNSMHNPDFGIYIHWPFCAAKCPYCDFNSHVRHEKVDVERFMNAFAKEIYHFRAQTGKKKINSVFFGGGTPSLMPDSAVGAILETLEEAWGFHDNVEITLEANPTSVDSSRFAGYRAAGVNRLSIGVQSLIDEDLKILGRLHSADEARKAIEIAQTHFDRHSFDLIYARPGQTLEAWENELNEALSLGAQHVSLYQLTIEYGTPFFNLYETGKLKVPNDNLAAEMYELTQSVCLQNDMPAYEISNHAKPGQECLHNLVYWRYGEYIGIGPGAHGRILIDNKRYATETERHPETWLGRVEASQHGIIVNDELSFEEQSDEFLLMGLRLKEGIDPNRFATLAGRDLTERQISALIADGMIEVMENGYIRVTPAGWVVLDAVVADLAA